MTLVIPFLTITKMADNKTIDPITTAMKSIHSKTLKAYTKFADQNKSLIEQGYKIITLAPTITEVDNKTLLTCNFRMETDVEKYTRVENEYRTELISKAKENIANELSKIEWLESIPSLRQQFKKAWKELVKTVPASKLSNDQGVKRVLSGTYTAGLLTISQEEISSTKVDYKTLLTPLFEEFTSNLQKRRTRNDTFDVSSTLENAELMIDYSTEGKSITFIIEQPYEFYTYYDTPVKATV